jgi:hypothetical protein
LHECASLVQTKICILRFGIFRNSPKNFLKNSDIFLKKYPKISYISLGRSYRVEILHDHALLVAVSNFILGFLLKSSEKISKKVRLCCFTMNVLKLDSQILMFWIFAVDFWKKLLIH